ncbi:hypothetical protein [Nocardiopsis alba]|uniref:Minor tail protein n=1 Tax=Nocardiopsis alba TaxID=53437 RepID=A0A7K2IL79_9ACTN|nr:hypothetical protein [Nocardiopsis alba]MYR30730.1 hypothetical protein [Nocardiopsis alba]
MGGQLQWLDRDLPASAPTIGYTLSGAGSLSATIDHTYEHLQGPDGRPLLLDHGTLLVVEFDDVIQAAGILRSSSISDGALQLTCEGFTSIADGQRITRTLKWGGKDTGGTTGNGVDPFAVVDGVFAFLQSRPRSNLGIVMQPGSTPYRLGSWYNARKLATPDDPNPKPSDIEPEIPINRVWTSADRRPTAATGQTLFWLYQLLWYDDNDAGNLLDELARQAPFDYIEHAAWSGTGRDGKADVRFTLRRGYPRLGGRRRGVLITDENLIGEPLVVSSTGGEYYNAVTAYGAGEGSKQLRVTASRDDGRLYRELSLDVPDARTAAALQAAAQAELARVCAPIDVQGFTIDGEHPSAPLGSFAVGDDIRISAAGQWGDIDMWVRVTAMDIDTETSQIDVTCSRSDGFDYSGGTG